MTDVSNDSEYKSLIENETLLFSPPKPSTYQHTTTGLVQCIISRQTIVSSRMSRLTSSSSSSKYSFLVQKPVSGSNGTASDDASYNQTLMVAEKVSAHHYCIRTAFCYDSGGTTTNDHNNQQYNMVGMKIGSLVRIQMNMYSITYALKNIDDMILAMIVYHVPTPIQVLRDPQARQAEVAIIHPTPSSDNHHHTSIVRKCMKHISKYHNISSIDNMSETGTTNLMSIYVSKKPITRTDGRVALNFLGRGRYPSPKNMQLMQSVTNNHGTFGSSATPSTMTTNIALQMCKWDDHVYNIDFSVSTTSTIAFIHAFAFGLAQIDL